MIWQCKSYDSPVRQIAQSYHLPIKVIELNIACGMGYDGYDCLGFVNFQAKDLERLQSRWAPSSEKKCPWHSMGLSFRDLIHQKTVMRHSIQ